jgi:MFS family permease
MSANSNTETMGQVTDIEPAGIKAPKNTSATRVIASTSGILVGVAGMEHGLFEILQGNVRPGGLVIEAIGPAQRLWEHGAEPAFTVIPNMLITGILAMAVGLLVIIWSGAFIDRKYGPLVMMLLSIALFLVGGGFAPLVLAVLPVAAATGINRPLTWWRRHLPPKLRGFLAGLWAWSLIVFALLCLFAMGVAIFGYPLLWFFSADHTVNLLSSLGNVTFFILGPVAVLTALAYDIQKQPDSFQTSSV